MGGPEGSALSPSSSAVLLSSHYPPHGKVPLQSRVPPASASHRLLGPGSSTGTPQTSSCSSSPPDSINSSASSPGDLLANCVGGSPGAKGSAVSFADSEQLSCDSSRVELEDAVLQFARWGQGRWEILHGMFTYGGTIISDRSCLKRQGVNLPAFCEFVRGLGFKGDAARAFRAISREHDGCGTKEYSPQEIRMQQLMRFERRCAATLDASSAGGTLGSSGSDPVRRVANAFRHSRGTVLRAWRLDLDRNNLGRVRQADFARACANLGVGPQGRIAWNALRPDSNTAPLKFHELEPQEAASLAAFADVLQSKTEFDLRTTWAYLDTAGRGSATLDDFVNGARRLGFDDPAAQTIFKGLDACGLGRISPDDLTYLKSLVGTRSRRSPVSGASIYIGGHIPLSATRSCSPPRDGSAANLSASRSTASLLVAGQRDRARSPGLASNGGALGPLAGDSSRNFSPARDRPGRPTASLTAREHSDKVSSPGFDSNGRAFGSCAAESSRSSSPARDRPGRQAVPAGLSMRAFIAGSTGAVQPLAHNPHTATSSNSFADTSTSSPMLAGRSPSPRLGTQSHSSRAPSSNNPQQPGNSHGFCADVAVAGSVSVRSRRRVMPGEDVEDSESADERRLDSHSQSAWMPCDFDGKLDEGGGCQTPSPPATDGINSRSSAAVRSGGSVLPQAPRSPTSRCKAGDSAGWSGAGQSKRLQSSAYSSSCGGTCSCAYSGDGGALVGLDGAQQAFKACDVDGALSPRASPSNVHPANTGEEKAGGAHCVREGKAIATLQMNTADSGQQMAMETPVKQFGVSHSLDRIKESARHRRFSVGTSQGKPAQGNVPISQFIEELDSEGDAPPSFPSPRSRHASVECMVMPPESEGHAQRRRAEQNSGSALCAKLGGAKGVSGCSFRGDDLRKVFDHLQSAIQGPHVRDGCQDFGPELKSRGELVFDQAQLDSASADSDGLSIDVGAIGSSSNSVVNGAVRSSRSPSDPNTYPHWRRRSLAVEGHDVGYSVGQISAGGRKGADSAKAPASRFAALGGKSSRTNLRIESAGGDHSQQRGYGAEDVEPRSLNAYRGRQPGEHAQKERPISPCTSNQEDQPRQERSVASAKGAAKICKRRVSAAKSRGGQLPRQLRPHLGQAAPPSALTGYEDDSEADGSVSSVGRSPAGLHRTAKCGAIGSVSDAGLFSTAEDTEQEEGANALHFTSHLGTRAPQKCAKAKARSNGQFEYFEQDRSSDLVCDGARVSPGSGRISDPTHGRAPTSPRGEGADMLAKLAEMQRQGMHTVDGQFLAPEVARHPSLHLGKGDLCARPASIDELVSMSQLLKDNGKMKARLEMMEKRRSSSHPSEPTDDGSIETHTKDGDKKGAEGRRGTKEQEKNTKQERQECERAKSKEQADHEGENKTEQTDGGKGKKGKGKPSPEATEKGQADDGADKPAEEEQSKGKGKAKAPPPPMGKGKGKGPPPPMGGADGKGKGKTKSKESKAGPKPMMNGVTKPLTLNVIEAADEESFWKKKECLIEDIKLQREVIEKLFAFNSASAFEKKDATKEGREDTRAISLTTAARSMTISIGTHKLRTLGAEGIRQSILSLDPETLTMESTERLLACDAKTGEPSVLPNAEEIAAAREHVASGVPNDCLNEASQIIVAVHNIPNIRDRLRFHQLRMTFSDLVSTTRVPIDNLAAALREVQESEKFGAVLMLVLKLGNVLNDGTQRGEAQGFRMDSLATISTLKGKASEQCGDIPAGMAMTFLDYLVEVIVDQRPDLLPLSEELTKLPKAIKIELGDIERKISQLRADVHRLKETICRPPRDGEDPDTGLSGATSFFEEALSTIDGMSIGLQGVKDGYAQAMRFFGDRSPSPGPLHEWFGFIYQFVIDLEKAHAAHQKRKADDLRKQKLVQQKAENQQRMRRLKLRAQTYVLLGGFRGSRRSSGASGSAPSCAESDTGVAAPPQRVVSERRLSWRAGFMQPRRASLTGKRMPATMRSRLPQLIRAQTEMSLQQRAAMAASSPSGSTLSESGLSSDSDGERVAKDPKGRAVPQSVAENTLPDAMPCASGVSDPIADQLTCTAETGAAPGSAATPTEVAGECGNAVEKTGSRSRLRSTGRTKRRSQRSSSTVAVESLIAAMGLQRSRSVGKGSVAAGGETSSSAGGEDGQGPVGRRKSGSAKRSRTRSQRSSVAEPATVEPDGEKEGHAESPKSPRSPRRCKAGRRSRSLHKLSSAETVSSRPSVVSSRARNSTADTMCRTDSTGRSKQHRGKRMSSGRAQQALIEAAAATAAAEVHADDSDAATSALAADGEKRTHDHAAAQHGKARENSETTEVHQSLPVLEETCCGGVPDEPECQVEEEAEPNERGDGEFEEETESAAGDAPNGEGGAVDWEDLLEESF